MTQLVIATHSAHKLKEFQAALAGTAFVLSSATDHKVGDIPETGTNFRENALLKAETVLAATGLSSLADDSGLIVTELGDFPGLHTKRFSEEMGGFDPAAKEIMRRLDGRASQAYYQCTLALCRPGHEPLIAEGRVDGMLIYPGRGTNNFGYDPWFVPAGETRTFGEMSLDEKRALDHRSRALNRLLDMLKEGASCKTAN